MKYGSICSGIESASIAWEPLGMSPSWFSEIENFPSEVLAHHWPDVMNLGDMCNLPYLVASGIIEAPDILVGGTPCQAFSVAGLRKGLSDERGQLTMNYVELLNEIDKKRPNNECVAVWENVPGVLSSKDNAFGCFLGALAGENSELYPSGKRWSNAGCVFGPQRTIAWRILDAQYFGVAQRRRRVFVVASARSGFNPQSVLFESEGVRRDIAPCRKTEKITPTSTRVSIAQGYRLMAFGEYEKDNISSTIQSRDYKGATDLVTYPIQNATRGASQNGLGVGGAHDPSYTLDVASQHDVCFAQNQRNEVREMPISGALSAQPRIKQTSHLRINQVIRRLTPTECERLQGFPDNHTRIPWRGKSSDECPDGPRYKAIGNSKAVPVIRWVGERLLREFARSVDDNDNMQ